MSSSRQRRASAPIRASTDDWARPGSWSGRGGDRPDQRNADTRFAPFGQRSFAVPASKPPRTAAALDLATPHRTPKQAFMPSVQAIKTATQAGSAAHMLDPHALSSAVGGGKKLAAKIAQKLEANQAIHKAFTHQVLGAVEKHGWGALHSASHQATQQFISKQLSSMTPKKKK